MGIGCKYWRSALHVHDHQEVKNILRCIIIKFNVRDNTRLANSNDAQSDEGCHVVRCLMCRNHSVLVLKTGVKLLSKYLMIFSLGIV